MDGFFYSSTPNAFVACLTNCKRCTANNNCDLCENPIGGVPALYPYQATTPHQCVECKPENSRFVNSGTQKCEDCPSTCTRCSSSTSCSQCKPNLYILSLSTGPCVACPSSTHRVVGSQCLRNCLSNEFTTTSNTCQTCPQYCLTCADGTGACETCQSGYGLKAQTLNCWKVCTTNEYRSDQNTCAGCTASNCSSCEDVTGLCDQCDSGYVLNAQKQCEKAPLNNLSTNPPSGGGGGGSNPSQVQPNGCLINQFKDAENKCQECPKSCSKCSSPSGACTECQAGFSLQTLNQACKQTTPAISIIRASFDQAKTEGYIIFNQKVVMKTTEAFMFKLIDPSGKREPIDLKSISKPSIDTSDRRLLLKFSFEELKQNFWGNNIEISITFSEVLKSLQDPRLSFEGYPVILKDVSHHNSAIEPATINIVKFSASSFNLMSLLLLLASVGLAVAMIKLFQLIFFLMFFNVVLPENLEKVINLFRRTIIDYFPVSAIPFLGGGSSDGQSSSRRLLQGSTSTAQGDVQGVGGFCVPHRIFDENDQSCSSLANTGKFVNQFLIFLTIKLIIVLLLKLLTPLLSKKKKVAEGQIKGKIAMSMTQRRQTIGLGKTQKRSRAIRPIFRSLKSKRGGGLKRKGEDSVDSGGTYEQESRLQKHFMSQKIGKRKSHLSQQNLTHKRKRSKRCLWRTTAWRKAPTSSKKQQKQIIISGTKQSKKRRKKRHSFSEC